ncbi:MAG: hypothetical protein ACUVS1_12095 [Actinomycetota bacterium]
MRRACLARALGPKTRFLAADEMAAMLDPVTQARIWKTMLGRVAEIGLGVPAISHDASLLAEIADGVLEISEISTR